MTACELDGLGVKTPALHESEVIRVDHLRKMIRFFRLGKRSPKASSFNEIVVRLLILYLRTLRLHF
jgi:hypothetical protein